MINLENVERQTPSMELLASQFEDEEDYDKLINFVASVKTLINEVDDVTLPKYGEETQKSIDDFKESFWSLPESERLKKSRINKTNKGEVEIKILEDKVNSPTHYNKGEIECIDAISAALSLDELKGFVKGNVIKYLWRANHKEKEVEDLKKARWYLDYLIKKLSQ